jgi:hypothetical protein
MTDTSGKGLRLARIAADSILKEKILPKGRLTKESVGIIASQLANIAGAMETVWESDPSSDELKEGFRLLAAYLDCLKRY